jgi:hypothetical protein
MPGAIFDLALAIAAGFQPLSSEHFEPAQVLCAQSRLA